LEKPAASGLFHVKTQRQRLIAIAACAQIGEASPR